MAGALSLATSGLAVGRARFSGPGASRSLLEQALGEVAIDGLGLGPEEVLYIPHLAGPARLRAGATRHFANGLGLVLGEIAGRAARDPIGGSATDQPCRFSSRTAFAAWLIGSVLQRGSAEAATLVRAATGRASAHDWWRRDVLSAGRSFVPVLVRLAEAGMAARWLASLDTVEIELATASLARDYGLALGQVDRKALPSLPGSRPIARINRGDAAADRYERTAIEEARAACAAIAARGEPLAELPVAARHLLVAAVLLARTPAAPRTALARAIARQADEDRPASNLVSSVATSLAPADTAPAAAPEGEEEARPLTQSPSEPPHRPIVMLPSGNRVAALSTADQRAPTIRADLPMPDASAKLSSPAMPQLPWNPFADPVIEPIPAALSEPQTAFDTAFGGLVFLVNAFLAMGLYPDFTRPLDPMLPLPPLALVDRLGLHWFGGRYRRDPLHRWIARRGPQGSLPRSWRVEPEWLAPFPAGRVWHDGSTLWHSAGFPLANRSASAPARRLARMLGVRLGSGAPGRSRVGAGRDPDWLDCLALFLAARFRRAAPDDALTPAALAIPARAVIGEARLDVHFALAALPITLRLAGLDRDPGWLPSEGRDLRFHFA
jgi:hypothetical protein